MWMIIVYRKIMNKIKRNRRRHKLIFPHKLFISSWIKLSTWALPRNYWGCGLAQGILSYHLQSVITPLISYKECLNSLLLSNISNNCLNSSNLKSWMKFWLNRKFNRSHKQKWKKLYLSIWNTCIATAGLVKQSQH